MDDRGFSPERIAALQAMYSSRQPHSTYAAMSPSERKFNDFIMNPFNWMAAGLGRKLVVGVSSKFARPVQIAGYIKRPIHSTLAYKSQWNQPIGRMLNQSLTVRKKLNTLALGYSLLNPTQNLGYLSRRDWKRLAINLHSPIIGVPIYEFYSHLMSGQSSGSSPTAQQIRSDRKSKPEQLGSRGDPTSARATQPTWAKRPDRTNVRSGKAAQPFVTKKRRWCKRHKKYDLCHRARW